MAGSTFLVLTNKVLARLNEVQLTSTTFATAAGVHLSAQQSVNNAIRTIHERHNEWPWLQATRTATTVAGTSQYSLASDVMVVDWNSFYLRNDDTIPVTGRWIPNLEWDEWIQRQRTTHDLTNNTAVPDFVVRDYEDAKFHLTLTPDNVYTVEYTVWTVANDLSIYSDACLIPSRYDYAIVEGALQEVYTFRNKMDSATLSGTRFEAAVKDMRTNLVNRYEAMRSGQLPYASSSSSYARVVK